MMIRTCVLCGKRYNWMENFVRRRLCGECEDMTDCSHIIYDGCKDLKKFSFDKEFQPFEVEEINTSSKTNVKVLLSHFPKSVIDCIQMKEKNVEGYL